MTRYVLPQVLIARGAALVEADEAGRTEEAVDLLRGAGLGQEDRAAALSLRWTVLPPVGLPRAPFRLWRLAERPPGSAKVADVRASGATTRTLPATCRQLEFTVDAASPGLLHVVGLDVAGQELPGQAVTVPVGRRGALRAPGLAAVRVTGSGLLRDVLGLTEHELANDRAWQLRQRVGLPWDKGEIDPVAYDTSDQGWVTPTLVLPPTHAADLRLELARALFLPPPPTGLATLPAPGWDPPDPQLYVRESKDAHSVLGLVAELGTMLQTTDDDDPSRYQNAYTVTAAGSGPHGPRTKASTAAHFEVPLLAATALTTASDVWGAVALGFGTYEILPRPLPSSELVLPPGVTVPDVEHMVTCALWVPTLRRPVEVAAIVELEGPPRPARNLTAATLPIEQAPVRDGPVRQPVRLRWDQPPGPQVYALTARRLTGVETLNAVSPAGGRLAYLAAVPSPSGSPSPVVEAAYVDRDASILPSVTATTTYAVAALDVHGRWSPWSSTARQSVPEPPQRPGLEAVGFEPRAGATSGGALPCDLVIDVTWDWTERTPRAIELHGHYVGAGSPTGPWTGGWQAAQNAAPGPSPVVLDFPLGPLPVVAGLMAGTATPVPLPAPDPAEPPQTRDLRRYRVRIQGMAPAFLTGSGGVSTYAVTARAREAVRPTVSSDPVGPRLAEVRDPSPPPTPALAPGVRWAALPDSTGVARGVLVWPPVPGAEYVVWQAMEPALWHAVGPSGQAPPRGTAAVDRARLLSTALLAAPEAALQAFTRITPVPLTSNRLEVELPAAAETLFAFRVSAVSAQGVESGRSTETALFGVPRLDIPGPPTLEARVVRDAQGAGVRLSATPGPGATPGRYLVLRVRRGTAAADAGSMGGPVATLAADDPQVTAESVRTRDGRTLPRLSLVDRVAPSWRPYHYRLVAEGRDLPVAGILPGESPPSGAVTVVVPPALPPVVDDLAVRSADTGSGRVVRLATDLPMERTSIGRARIEVAVVTEPLTGAVTRMTVHALDADALADVAGLPPAQTPGGGATTAVRVGADAEGLTLVDASLPPWDGTSAREHVVVTVTDPLGRSTTGQALLGVFA